MGSLELEKNTNLKHIASNYLSLSPITLEDNSFIFSLRHQKEGIYLKAPPVTLEQQIAYYHTYLDKYHQGEEIYYKIYDNVQERYCGVVRLTELHDQFYFNWQSLIVDPLCSPQIGIDIMMVIYSVGFEVLGREMCGPWVVDRHNLKTMKIHHYMDLTENIKSDQEYFYLQVPRARFLKNAERMKKRGFGVLKFPTIN